MNTTQRDYNKAPLFDTLWDSIRDLAPILIPLGIFVLSLVVYANTSDGWIFYSWDDNRYISENPLIREGLGPGAIWDIFSQNYFAAYLPVTILSYAVEYTLWGLNATGYHVVNIILHGMNGALVYLFVKRLYPSQRVALVAALIFALHPLQVENVAWISQRKSLLCMFFFMWSWLAHIASADDRSNPLLIVLAWFFFLLSVLSKPTAVLAFILFAFFDFYWMEEGYLSSRGLIRIAWRTAPYFIIGLVGGLVMISAHSDYGGIKDAPGGTFLKSIAIMLWAFWGYTTSIFAPLDLNPLYIYDVDQATFTNPEVLAGLLVLFFLGLVALVQPFGRPYSRFAILWVVVMILPVSNIIPIAIQRADRYMYFPLIVIGMLAAIVFDRAWESIRGEGRYLLAGVVGAVLMMFTVLTVMQNQIWHNEDTLWADNLKDEPQSETGLLNRGVHFYRERDFQTAEVLFRELLDYYPNHYKGNRFLGLIRLSANDYQDASFYLNRAVQLQPNTTDVTDELVTALIELGRGYVTTGQYQEAINTYAVAARYDSGRAGAALIELGVTFFNQGRYEQALQTYAAAAKLVPNEPVLFNNVGYTYFRTGDLASAIDAYQRATQLDPTYIRAWMNLGDAALQGGNNSLSAEAYAQAVALGASMNAEKLSNYCLALAEIKAEQTLTLNYCQQAIGLEPTNGLYLGRAAHALIIYGLFDQALPLAQQAVQAAPNLSLGYRALGDAYAATGNAPAAIEAYNRALAINPDNTKAQEGLRALTGQ